MVELLTLSVLLGLAVWRVASLLHTEDAFGWLRRWIGISTDVNKYPAVYPDTLWGKVFNCFWCLTVPLSCAGAVYVGLAVQLRLWAWPVVALASSAVAIWIEKQVMRSQAR